MKSALAIFENFKIRRQWNKKEEKWHFSVVDIIAVITEQKNLLRARKYWNKLAERLRIEGSEAVTKCHRLKMLAADGKKYL
ncbi:MAG: hypothetical protein Q8P29_00800 [Candidatus Levybacteria bacterium]|nr:hypothetical protein [Candidatus Levybacteria bacterium]